MDTDLIELASDGSRTLHSRSTTPVDGGDGQEGRDTADLNAKIRDLEARIERLERNRDTNQWDNGTTQEDENTESQPNHILAQFLDHAAVTAVSTADTDGSPEAAPLPLSWNDTERYAIPLAFLCLWLCIGMRFIFEAY
jgi:TolA-binding protein